MSKFNLSNQRTKSGPHNNMKLLGVTNGKKILTSIAHYDYRSFGEGEDYIMMDGGAAGLNNFGYNRFSVTGRKLWFEVPQTFAELYNDWNVGNPRKYGIWNLEDVRVLPPEEIPDTESFEWRAENEIWGTNGLDGKSATIYVLLKDCELDHLKKISELCERRRNDELKRVADYWIKQKSSNSPTTQTQAQTS
jgi:hypothetical protein